MAELISFHITPPPLLKTGSFGVRAGMIWEEMVPVGSPLFVRDAAEKRTDN
jgi:hypothetical protein